MYVSTNQTYEYDTQEEVNFISHVSKNGWKRLMKSVLGTVG